MCIRRIYPMLFLCIQTTFQNDTTLENIVRHLLVDSNIGTSVLNEQINNKEDCWF